MLPSKDFILNSIDVDTNGCWLWLSTLNNQGYGLCRHNRKLGAAHRMAYRIFVNEIAPGLVLHHKCMKPSCVNPLHLVPLTRKEHGNMHLKSFCVHGHELSVENVYVREGGKRQCKRCAKDNVYKWRMNRKIT